MNRIGFSCTTLVVALVVVLGSLAPTTAEAQQSVSDGLSKCAAILNAAERLFCFDSLAAGNEVQMPEKRAATTSTAGRGDSGATPVAATRPAMQPASEPARDESDFGRELQQAREGPESVSSRYDGTFRGWTGDTVFQLENGQVWKQSETDRLSVTLERPMITVRRGWFGAYYLKVEGANKQVKVKRIK